MRIAAPPAPSELPRGQKPTFAVIIAAYQSADVIGQAIESVLAQSLAPREIIVCDDGSTDELADALAPYRARIKLLSQQNGGEAAAKNTAARAASAEFVTILDADDSYEPGRVQALADLAEQRPDLGLLTTDAFLEVEDEVVGLVYTESWSFPVVDQRKEILRRNFVFGHAAVRRAALLEVGGFDEAIRRTADWDCWIRLLLSGVRAGAVLEPLSRYRVRPQALSADREGMLLGSLATLGKAERDPRLDARERLVVRGSIVQRERELQLVQLRRRVRERSVGVRREALRLALGRAVGPRTRLKAAGAALAPRLAGRLLQSREAGWWIGAGGTRVERR